MWYERDSDYDLDYSSERECSSSKELLIKHVLVPFLHELVRVPNRYAGARLGELWRGAHARGDRCKVVGECGGGVLRS